MTINIRDILNELSLEALKEVCKIKGIKIESRRRMDYIEELSAYDWFDEELKKLSEIFKKDKENAIKAVMIYIFRASRLIELSEDEVKSALTERTVDFSKEEINGFRIIDAKNNVISYEYWYTQKKVLIDDTGNIHYFRMPSQIKFEISLLDGLLTIHAINPGLALKCKKSIEETLGINAVPISPLEV